MDETNPPSPASHLAAPRVLLIQAEWPARALLKAELEACGCDVLAADRVATAVRLATARGFRPTVVVVDAFKLDAPPDDLRALGFLHARRPLILLSSHQLHDPLMAELSP